MNNQQNEINELFELQKKAKENISASDYRERKEKLRRLLKQILDYRDEITDAIYNDFRKSKEETHLTEIIPVTVELRYVMRNLKKWMKPKRVFPPIQFFGSQNKIIYRPKGNCLIISPWNYPFLLAIGPIISAVAAGNTVILKPAERTPNTSALLKRLLEGVFSKEELAVVEGDKVVSQKLLELPFDHIFFTGGTEIGKIIMSAAAKNLTSVTLELGGKSPVIIDRSANIDLAAKRIAWGKFINSGQTCIAPDYVLADAAIIDEVKEKIKLFAQKYYKDEEDTPYSGIVDETHKSKLTELLNDAVEKGANPEKINSFNHPDKFDPVILTGIKSNSEISHQEIFGPILPVTPYKSEEELFNIINENPNPLSLYIFSRNKKFIDLVTKKVNTGSVVVNETVLHFADYKLPFGGVRQSGIGRSHGYYGFLEFSNETAFFKQPRFSVIGMLYPPYNNFKRKVIDITERYL